MREFLSDPTYLSRERMDKEAFINHVDMVGEGVYKMSTLLRRPYFVKLLKEEGVKNIQMSVHMVYV